MISLTLMRDWKSTKVRWSESNLEVDLRSVPLLPNGFA